MSVNQAFIYRTEKNTDLEGWVQGVDEFENNARHSNSGEYLISCIFNEKILKTCSLILGTVSCVLVLFLDRLLRLFLAPHVRLRECQQKAADNKMGNGKCQR